MRSSTVSTTATPTIDAIRRNTAALPEPIRNRLFQYLSQPHNAYDAHKVSEGKVSVLADGAFKLADGSEVYLPPTEDSEVLYFGFRGRVDYKALFVTSDGGLAVWKDTHECYRVDVAQAWAWISAGMSWEDGWSEGTAWSRFAEMILRTLCQGLRNPV